MGRASWDDSVECEELTSPEPIGVGSRVGTRMRSMGRGYEIDWEIVEHEPPTHQRIQSTSGPFRTTPVYDLARNTDGTSVRFSITGQPTGLLRLMQPLIAWTTQRNLDSGFARLKEVLEGTP